MLSNVFCSCNTKSGTRLKIIRKKEVEKKTEGPRYKLSPLGHGDVDACIRELLYYVLKIFHCEKHKQNVATL